MKEEYLELDDAVYQLDQLNSVLGILHSNFCKDFDFLMPDEAVEMALYHIYDGQRKALEKIHEVIDKD